MSGVEGVDTLHVYWNLQGKSRFKGTISCVYSCVRGGPSSSLLSLSLYFSSVTFPPANTHRPRFFLSLGEKEVFSDGTDIIGTCGTETLYVICRLLAIIRFTNLLGDSDFTCNLTLVGLTNLTGTNTRQFVGGVTHTTRVSFFS